MLQDRLGVSERRACQIAGQHRSTQRREPVLAEDDAALRARLRRLSRKRPRWGYRRAHTFQFDQTADGHILKLLHVVDEFTREALAIKCARRIDADATVKALESLTASRGRAPEFVRCDNGPEMTANALKDWCRFAGTGTSYIDPGSPWQNPYVESFGSRVRDELLAVEQFSCLAEAKVLIEDWREDYNEHRPHSALGMKTPARFAKACRAQHEPPAASLRSPYGLTPRDGGTPTLQQTKTHRLSQQVDP
jgi:putative transposase